MALLHPTKTFSSIQPRFVSQFACIGPQCEDNCCTGWRVTIDRKTFNAYRRAKEPALNARFQEKLHRDRKAPQDSAYGHIQLEPTSLACPFLEERLCAVQREMGEDKLSDTCSTYPRGHRSVGGQHEQSITLSCPEAARLALLSDDAMDLEQASAQARLSMVHLRQPARGLSVDTFTDLRSFAYQLIRAQGLELWQKLAVLAIFCERLTELIQAGEQAQVQGLADNFRTMITSGAVEEALAALPPNHEMQALAFAALWQLKIKARQSQVQEQVQKAVALGLGADPETWEVSRAEVVRRYRQGLENFDAALEQAPRLLENYLLNEVFAELFPFGAQTPHQHFLKLITRFGMVRLMLVAQCVDRQHLPDAAQMARTVQVFCRRYQHDTAFAYQVSNALESANWTRLDKIYQFLRT